MKERGIKEPDSFLPMTRMCLYVKAKYCKKCNTHMIEERKAILHSDPQHQMNSLRYTTTSPFELLKRRLFFSRVLPQSIPPSVPVPSSSGHLVCVGRVSEETTPATKPCTPQFESCMH
ncbi:hypothetical protein E2C01_004498 [Portunus trituberculatus]|uniref:Uncharacterized protein n=1 Tax=Portunus trituberculatus TaxID=210409 RepID=A0A5B7CWJ5_PORTR|nr:hypothetical protein [Portunus trituberculatus]